jgi:hypothetical protein
MDHFTFSNVLFTVAGAIVFWARKGGRSELKAYGLSDMVTLLPWNRGIRTILEFVIFIVLGCVVGIGFTEPSNPRQALTAGFGWTSLLAVGKNTKEQKS